MSRDRYRDVLFLLVGALLVLVFGRQYDARFDLLNTAYAQSQTGSADWVLMPVGNQEVRRLVIWDRTTNTVYDYDSGGQLENTWVITTPGQRIQKR
jgi:hypothetical protein